MLISEYLQLRNLSVQMPRGNSSDSTDRQSTNSAQNSPFAKTLKEQLEKQTVLNSKVEFSKHALDRVAERNIDLTENNTLERLDKAVEAAQQKGANDALVLIDSTAFLVSVKNNKVITTVSADDLQGNVFTNIDSAVIG
ncbi:MAG TPA: TIGR02530 family flagellar biosynthesis protein [Oscillospiraceae bacterium]|jgi:flagellar operon protein|nr:TIGR02530 family flagellar biosynthesis protein [Oscillospiraceae bacterium]